jgi:hypothetical protein
MLYILTDFPVYFAIPVPRSLSSRSKISARKERAIKIVSLLHTDEHRDDPWLPCGSQGLLCHGYAGVIGATNWRFGSISRAPARQVRKTMDLRVA